MPADDSLGLHDDEDICPARPKAAKGRPEESVQGVQHWARPFTFEDRDLLAEGEDFEGRVTPTAKEDSDGGEDGEGEFRHELTVVTWLDEACGGHPYHACKSLKSCLRRGRIR
jgi:hypothetical protein